MTAPTATPPVGTMAIPSARQQFLDVLKKEHETTRRVVEAYPSEQSEFAPHPRSSNARRLVWTFAIEEYLILAALKDQLNVGAGLPKGPDAWSDVVAAFKKNHAEVVEALESARDEDFFGTVKFFTGPGTIGDVPKNEFMYFILSDQIHHRGQLSVYLRMAGGKVPSIYGPSADEPWF
ncbi:MAG TPA: DinB family protein [Gemmatimonadaceae bacterium]